MSAKMRRGGPERDFGLLVAPDRGDEVPCLLGGVRRDEDQVGRTRGQREGDRDVGQDTDRGLTLRGARGDRRASDREPFPFEVDVVELVPVDEPPRRHVADLRVVLPAVPEAAHDLDEVRRLVEEVGDRRRVARASPERVRRR